MVVFHGIAQVQSFDVQSRRVASLRISRRNKKGQGIRVGKDEEVGVRLDSGGNIIIPEKFQHLIVKKLNRAIREYMGRNIETFVSNGTLVLTSTDICYYGGVDETPKPVINTEKPIKKLKKVENTSYTVNWVENLKVDFSYLEDGKIAAISFHSPKDKYSKYVGEKVVKGRLGRQNGSFKNRNPYPEDYPFIACI